MTEQSIVQAFKAYFDKSILPFVSQNNEVMRQWSHLNKIISSDPIDYSQIEFYLLLANKSSGGNLSAPKNSYQPSSTDNIKDSSMKKSQFSGYARERLNVSGGGDFEKKGSFIGSTTHKKKNLIGSLQKFHKMLVQNQERLQQLSRNVSETRGMGPNSSVSNLPVRRY